MTIATRILKALARGAVSPIVAEQVRRVRTDEVEAVLYPSDLLLRGAPTEVARVRAMMSRTHLDADAYLVRSDGGQCIQDELHRLHGVVDAHAELGVTPGRTFDARLAEVWRELSEAELTFEEWVMLEAIARRLERNIVRRRIGPGALPLDREEDALGGVATEANAEKERQEKVDMAIEIRETGRLRPELVEETSTTTLVKEALDEAKELVKLEVELAKEEVKLELKKVERAAIAFGIGAVMLLLMLCMLAVAIVLAWGTSVAALIVAACFLVLAGCAAFAGYAMLPKKPLEKTRHRLGADVSQLKEHLA
jgi:hypothetical protein